MLIMILSNANHDRKLPMYKTTNNTDTDTVPLIAIRGTARKLRVTIIYFITLKLSFNSKLAKPRSSMIIISVA